MHSINSSASAAGSSSVIELTSRNADPFTYMHYGPEGIEGRFRILPVNHTSALQTGLDLLNQQPLPLALLGISLGNPFFTRKRIEITVCGLAQLFDQVVIVIPDAVAMHTFRAFGYHEHKVQTKARTEGNTIRNRCLRAIERAQMINPSADLRILDWERDISSLPGYWDAYAQVCRLFDTNEHFQKDVLNKGYAVLAKKLPQASITRTAVRECIEYLLKEFAYLMLCRATFDRNLVIPYHQDFSLGQGFCDGTYQEPLHGVGCLIFAIERTDEDESLTTEQTEPSLMSAL